MAGTWKVSCFILTLHCLHAMLVYANVWIWKQAGPKEALFKAIANAIGDISIIAEDLVGY